VTYSRPQTCDARQPQKGDALYGLISAGRQVVAIESGRSVPLSVLDTQLLLNFLASNDALRWAEGLSSAACG
jgi:hypothetical protein